MRVVCVEGLFGILLDGRMPPWGGPTKIDVSKYNVFNYYQTGFVRGHVIKGATKNVEVKGLSHLMMPYNPDFILDFFKVYRGTYA